MTGLAASQASADELVLNSVTAVATSEPTGWLPANHEMALDGNGHAVIAYKPTYDGALHVVRCHDEDCSSSSDVEIAEGGHPMSVAVDPNGNPAVLYWREDADYLYAPHWLAVCSDNDCSTVDNHLVFFDDLEKGTGVITFDDAGNLLWGGSTITSPTATDANDLLVRWTPNDQPFWDTAEVLHFGPSPSTFGADVGGASQLSLDANGNPQLWTPISPYTYQHRGCADSDCSTSTATEYWQSLTYSIAIDEASQAPIHGGPTAHSCDYERCLSSDCDSTTGHIELSGGYSYDVQVAAFADGSIAAGITTSEAGRQVVFCDASDECNDAVTIEPDPGGPPNPYSEIAVASDGDVVFAYMASIDGSSDYELRVARLERDSSDDEFCSLFDGETVTLLTKQGRYISADSAVDDYEFSQSEDIGDPERFEVECYTTDAGEAIALYTVNGLYMSNLPIDPDAPNISDGTGRLAQSAPDSTRHLWMPELQPSGNWAFISAFGFEEAPLSRGAGQGYAVDLTDSSTIGARQQFTVELDLASN